MADWKTDLRNAYRSSAKWAVKDSNKTFDKTISDTGRDALTRGLGRSSYTTQTLANLETDKNEAGNRIRSEFELEYQKALQQREMEEARLAEERRQFDLKMGLTGDGSGGGGGGYGGGGYGGNPGGGVPNNNTGNTQTAADLARTLKEIADLKNANAAAYANRNNFRGGGLKTNSLMTR